MTEERRPRRGLLALATDAAAVAVPFATAVESVCVDRSVLVVVGVCRLVESAPEAGAGGGTGVRIGEVQ